MTGRSTAGLCSCEYAKVSDENETRLTVRRRPAPELPSELADEVNPQNFADFTAALAGAAKVVPLTAGGAVTFTDG
jgi:hypothetical protein